MRIFKIIFAITVGNSFSTLILINLTGKLIY